MKRGFRNIFVSNLYIKNGLDVLCFHTGKSRFDIYCTKCFVGNGSSDRVIKLTWINFFFNSKQIVLINI